MNDMIGSMNTSSQEPSADRLVVESLQPQDVLMGRGACPSEHTGNDTFRKFVEDGMVEYFGTTSSKRKNQIAKKIVKRIKANSGLFVKKLKERDLRSLGLRTDGGRFLVVDDKAAITKAKQTFRYLCRTSRMPKEDLKRKSQEKVVEEHDEDVRASRAPRARKEKEPGTAPRDTRVQVSSLESSSSFGQNIAGRPGELMFLAHACSWVLGYQQDK